jgi:hypothetical protein
MKLTTLILSLFLSNLLFSQELSEFDLAPYNDELKFSIVEENEVLEADESIEAIIFVFNKPAFKNAELSIKNNPQVKEIKLFGSNQDFVNFLSAAELPKLSYLFIERYMGIALEIPSFPSVEVFTIQSSQLVNLNMLNAEMEDLAILDIDAPKLENWSAAKSYSELGLINLVAPQLAFFPIENMPSIAQFSYECAFKVMPLNLCSYKEICCISFSNYGPIEVDECFIKMVKKGVYSNITIYDKMDGKIISETLSNDRKE